MLKLLKKKDIQSDIKYSSNNVFIKIEGKEYKLKIDSIEVFKKAIDMQKNVESLENTINNNPESITKIVKTVQDFILMILGGDAYNSIFDTDDKKDDYYWHLVIFTAIFGKIIEYKTKQFNDIVTSPMLDQIKKLEALQNR